MASRVDVYIGAAVVDLGTVAVRGAERESRRAGTTPTAGEPAAVTVTVTVDETSTASNPSVDTTETSWGFA